MLVYFYSVDGGVTRKGPYTASQLDAHRCQGKLPANAQVWTEEYMTMVPPPSDSKKATGKTRTRVVIACIILFGLFIAAYDGGSQTGKEGDSDVPLPGLFPGDELAESTIPEGVIRNMEILQELQIPQCCFENTPVFESFFFLKGVARKSGVMLNLMVETYGGPEPVIPYLNREEVTALELLKAICDTSGCAFRVEESGVFVYPKSVSHLAERWEYQPQNAVEQRLLDTLKGVIIRHCAFDGASVEEALMFLLAETRQADVLIDFVYVGERDVVIPPLDLEQMNAYDVLRCICRRSGCVFWVAEGKVQVAPEDEMQE